MMESPVCCSLFVLPHLPSYSEVWLDRMIDSVSGRLAIATMGSNSDAYRGRTVFDIGHLPEVGLSHHKISAALPTVSIARLRRHIGRGAFSSLLVHYGNLGVTLRPALETFEGRSFVHFHGYDLKVQPYGILSKRRTQSIYEDDIVALSQSSTLIANSEFTRSILESFGVPVGRIVVRYLGVPVPPVRTVGPFKIPTVRAFELMREMGVSGRLLIAGDGPLRRPCEEAARRSPWSDSIRVLGAVSSEIGSRLRANATVFTAHNQRGATGQEEAFGVSVVEAMAAGIPVVSARSGALPETVVSGVTGFLVEPGDVRAHADALGQLLRDRSLNAQMGAASRSRVIEHFSPTSARASVVDLLAEGK
jgi:hypothetical protein